MAQAVNDTNQLIGQLRRSDDWQVRRRAALALGGQRTPGAFEALAAALHDRDPDVRHASVLALGELGDNRAIELLCRPVLLEDPSPVTRWAAISSLGKIGSLTNAHALTRALEDAEWVVRNQALLVMADYIRRIPDTVDGEQIKDLIRLLAVRDTEVRGLVVDALSRRSTRGLDEMVEAMKLRSRTVRAGVAEALGLSQDPRATAPLIEATRDPVGWVRTEAARGLGRLKDPWAVEALIMVLGDSDRRAARAAREALVAIGSKAVAPLCAALEHTLSKQHRRNVILTLGKIGDRSAVVPLLNSLSSSYYVVRQAAITALSAFGELVVDDLGPMVEISAIPLDALIHEVTLQQNKRLRLRAVRALGEIKNPAAIKPLRALLDEGDRTIKETTQEALSRIGLAAWARHGAVVALGNIGNIRALPALLRALEDHSEVVRSEAARALAKLGDSSSVPHLVATLEQDEDPAVRREAAAALRALGVESEEVAEVLRAALGDSSWEVRAEGARALGRIDDPTSVAPLLGALEDSSYTVTTAAEHALANLGRLALPRLLESAANPGSAPLGSIVEVLVEILGIDHRPALVALIDLEPEERRERIVALAAEVGVEIHSG